jgi:hypothetical protein
LAANTLFLTSVAVHSSTLVAHPTSLLEILVEQLGRHH